MERALDLERGKTMDVTTDLEMDPIEAMLADGLDADRCYRLLSARDARFDGRLFVGVRSTGIFCRPICPARTPKARNCTFWRSAAAAQAAGFRPCLRCRPEAAPGTPAWRGTAASVSRAMRLIEDGALDGEGSVESLAGRLGIGARHLRRLFDQHLGTTPRAVAKMRRVLFAKQMISETTLPMSEVAMAAGFSSQRRFNACMREVYGRPPTELRRKRRSRTSSGSATGTTIEPVRMTLSYRPPLSWDALLEFLELRAIPGVEGVTDAVYSRTLRLGEGLEDGVGVVRVGHDQEKHRLEVEVYLSSTTGLIDVATRLRRLFDLDADGAAIDAVLGRLSRLRPHLRKRPGVRVPGTVDGFETAVRAILGQQISVKGATTFAERIVARWGTPLADVWEGGVPEGALPAETRALFPDAEALAAAKLEEIGLTGARAETIRGVARAVLEDPSLLSPASDLSDALAAWQRLKGIGPWTAQYVAMRVLREPDGLPTGDLVLRKAITKRGEKPRPAGDVEKVLEVCRPYRAYAAIRLWDGYSAD